jgi:YD repeat-containing protein
MRYWVHYWRNQTVLDAEIEPAELRAHQLDHTAGNNFRRRGLAPGDVIYIATVFAGTLALVGSLSVAEVVDQPEAERILDQGPLWDASDHVIASMSTGWINKRLTLAQARRVRVINARGAETRLMIDSNGRLSRQTLRGFREVTIKTARMFDTIAGRERRSITAAGDAGSAPLPDIDLDYSADEGAAGERRHLQRDRDHTLRRMKINDVRSQGHKIACEACGFDFEATYGARGEGYIEVHHLRPLHDSGPVRSRLEDLALLCSNCHRMVHRRRPWLRFDQLKRLVQSARRRP